MCGSKHAKTTSTVTIPAEVMANYRDVVSRAKAAADKPFQAYGNQASDYVAQMNAQQGAGISGINAAAGVYQPYITSATNATNAGMGPADLGQLDINKYLSPYLSQVQGSTVALMNQSNEQAQSGALGSAISSGAFGGDRAGIAAANLNQQNQLAMGKTMADIANQGYGVAANIAQGQQAADLAARQANLARQMQGGQQLSGLGAQAQGLGLQGAQAQLAAGTMQQQTEQAGKDAMVQRFMQEQGYPFQVAQYLANIAMGTGALSGTTTTSRQPLNMWGEPLATGGAVHGYADGGGVAGPRTSVQAPIGGEGYVPMGDLPVGQLMAADLPSSGGSKSGGTTDKLLKLAEIFGGGGGGGMASGGVVGGRHGYATDGSVDGPYTAELRRQQEIRDAVPGLVLADRARTRANDEAAFWEHTLPSTMGTDGHMDVPQTLGSAVHPSSHTTVAPAVTGVVSPIPVAEEAWDVPVRSGPTYQVTQRSGPTEMPVIPQRSGQPPMITSPRPHPGLVGQNVIDLAGNRPMPRPAGLEFEQPVPAIPSPPDDLGSIGVGHRPMPRPAGLSDVITNTPVSTSGVIPHLHPDQQPNRGIRLSTQGETMLGEPEMDVYASRKYSNPDDAAYYASTQYEGNDKLIGSAQQNARRIYTAIQNGGDGLSPNELVLYQQFKASGKLDDIQIAGLLGRLNVEAGAGINPNARNDLGGGHGTYGIFQARGPRFEKLARAGGMTPEQLEQMPVTNGLSSGPGGAETTPGGGVVGPQEPIVTKPYSQRNAIGQFFHNEDGSLNQSAIGALLSGLAGATTGNTLASSLLRGLGTGYNAYSTSQTHLADLAKTNIENTKEAMANWLNAKYSGATNLSWPEYANQFGINLKTYNPYVMGSDNIITSEDTRGYVMRDGIKIPFMQDYQSLNDLINQNSGVDPNSPMGKIVAQAIIRRDEIAKTGTTTGTDQYGNPVSYKDPSARGVITAASEMESAKGRNDRFGESATAFGSSAPVVDNSINELTNLLTTITPGVTNPLVALGDAFTSAFGITSGDYASKTQQALAKSLEPMIADAMSGKMTGPAADALAGVRSQLMAPTLQAGAVRDSIATARAVIDYQQKAYDEYYNKGGQSDPDVMGDPMKFMQKYEKQHPFAKVKEHYMDYHVTPPLLGEPAPAEYLARPGASQEKWNSYPTEMKIKMLDAIANNPQTDNTGAP